MIKYFRLIFSINSCRIFLYFYQYFLMATNPPPPYKTVKVYEEQGNGFYMAQFKTGQLAIFSYYLQSNKEAILIDPTYDVAPYEQIRKARQSKITAVALTHYHADYVAGHLQLGLPVFMGENSPRENTNFKICEQKDNSTFQLGQISIKVLHTPGHTMQSSVFVLNDKEGKQIGAFTGDTIFLGEIGRPDLAVSEKMSKQDLARLLFASIQKCKKQLGDDVKVFPGHGAGSSCGKSIGQGNYCTMATQKQKNYALKINDEQEFVKTILNEMPKPPSYFFHDAKINQTGASTFTETQSKVAKALTIDQFAKQMANGATVIDSRLNNEGGCIEGSLLMHEAGTLAVWVGDMLSADTKILLFCQKGRHQDFIARLLRIGYFNILGYNDFTIQDWKAKQFKTYECKKVTAKQLGQLKDYSVLDVRKPGQWKQTGIVEGAKLIVLSQLPQRWAEVKDMKNIYINCRSGWRAKLAMSILHNNGIDSTVIDDKFLNFADCGIKTCPYA